MKTNRFYILVLAGAAIGTFSTSANALSSFKRAYDKTYVKESNDADYKKAFKKASCNTCHVKGKKKDWLNPYGLELAKLVGGNAKKRLDANKKGSDERKVEEKKIEKELLVAFEKAAKLKAPDGTTYAAMFKARKFPSPDGAKSLAEKKPDDAKKE